MGFAKERWLEQGEHGHSLDLAKNYLGVCPDCIVDDGLRHFVTSHAQIERCDFCGGAGPQGLNLGKLFDLYGRSHRDRVGPGHRRAA